MMQHGLLSGSCIEASSIGNLFFRADLPPLQDRRGLKFLHLFRYVQIVVSKQRRCTKPTNQPGNDLQPYDVNTVDNQPYIAAELDTSDVNKNSVFTVGDGEKYVRTGRRKRRSIEFQNVKLEPETCYSVLQRAFKSAVSGEI